MSERRDAAWDALYKAVPVRWRVGAVTHDPGRLRAEGHPGARTVTAHGPTTRGNVPVTVTVTGDGEVAASATSKIDFAASSSPMAGGWTNGCCGWPMSRARSRGRWST